MLVKRIMAAITAAAVACAGASFALASEPETVAYADFETDTGSFVVESSSESYPLQLSSKYPGWLDVGNGWGSVYVPDDKLAGENSKVTVSFEAAYGKLVGKYFYHVISDSNGTELVHWSYSAYDGSVAKNVFGTAVNELTAADFYSESSEPVTDYAAEYTYVFDFAAGTVTLSIHNKYDDSTAVHTAELPEGVRDVKSLRIGSDYTNTSRQCVVDNIKITTEESDEELVPYTINYVMNGEVVRSRSASVAPGTEIEPESVFVYNGVKYYSESSESMTVQAGEENIFEVPVREAEKYTVSIKAGGDLDEIIREYEVTEGESVSYVYPMYMLKDYTLYVTEPGSTVYYGGTIENVTESMTIDIDYLEMYDTCVMYDELDATDGENAAVRASNGSAFANQEYMSSKEIEPGKYTFIVRYLSKGRGSALKIGDQLIKEIGLGDERGSWLTAVVENVEVTEGGYITLEAGSGKTRDCLDTVAVISENPIEEEPELYENRIRSIEKSDDEIRVRTELVTAERGTLYTAMYSKDGVLVGMDTAEITEADQTTSVSTAGMENVRTVRAYLWDGSENMEPIAETKEFEILITQPSQTTPTAAQQLQIDRKYGMFIHFGINTFSPDGADWTDGTLSPDIYTPETIDADQWVKAAKDAGMSYVILVTKHHDGFCLFDTEYTDYCVTNSPNQTDVVKAVADACEKYGIQLGLYYSLWDRHERTYNNDERYVEYMKNQITELLDGRYGEIVEFWLDGGWDKTNERWHMDELYDLVKQLQPNCVFGVNHTIGIYNSPGYAGNEYQPPNYKENMPMKYFPSDFRLLDPKYTKVGADADPKLYMHDGKQYYLPFEATICVKQKGKWFWSPSYPELLNITPQHIAQKYKDFTEQQNVLIVNCAPNREGRLEQYDIDAITMAGQLIGIGSGSDTQIYEFEDSSCTAGSDAGSFGISTATADYSGSGFIGGWTGQCSAEFSVSSESERTARIALVYGNGNGANTAHISVNGEHAADINIYDTASWAFVMSQYVEIPLAEGENKITITTDEGKGPNMDCIYIQ